MDGKGCITVAVLLALDVGHLFCVFLWRCVFCLFVSGCHLAGSGDFVDRLGFVSASLSFERLSLLCPVSICPSPSEPFWGDREQGLVGGNKPLSHLMIPKGLA